MAKAELKGKALETVHKLVYLANEYPNKTMREVAALFELPPLDINIAVWRAEDMGFLHINEDGKFHIDKVPTKWELGEDLERLKEQIIYYFNHLARKEADLEETYLSNLAMGYPPHDLFIVIKQLLHDRVLGTYELKDTRKEGKKHVVDTYTFYSLWDNSEQQWGKKQFKDETKVK